MQRVISINLNGNAYQIEETGFSALTAYLERALAQLAGNPDRTEILADLEQAIAEKCQRTLNAHKSVVTQDEVQQILQEMGPVDGAAGTGESGAAAAPGAAGDASRTGPVLPKRLYKITEGKVISGVCQGLAAYFDLDVVLVRMFFVVINVLSGLGFLLYILLAIVLPRAETPEERAAAYGHRFNAQELIDEAKRSYAAFGASRDRRRQWRQQRREWKRRWRAARWDGAWMPPDGPAGYAATVATGVIVPIFSIVNAVALIVLVLAVISLFSTGAIFGWVVPDNIPHWLAAIVLLLIYQAIAAPTVLLRHGPYVRAGRACGGWIASTSNGLLQLGVMAFVVWLAYHHVPAVHDFIDDIPRIWHTLVTPS